MGQAFDRSGEVLGDATGATKKEVFDALQERFPEAAEIRVRSASMAVERLTAENVEDAFNYQPWDHGQQLAGEAVRQVLMQAAKVVLACVPETPLRTRALNNLIDARMIANAAITFKGRF